jgi:hypothetical protein
LSLAVIFQKRQCWLWCWVNGVVELWIFFASNGPPDTRRFFWFWRKNHVVRSPLVRPHWPVWESSRHRPQFVGPMKCDVTSQEKAKNTSFYFSGAPPFFRIRIER